MKIDMQCNECGKKFKAASLEGRCPKCRGSDFEPCTDADDRARRIAYTNRQIEIQNEALRKNSQV